ncbi:N-acetyltransferase [Longimycelium tulufanense]|uniref:N-acetyltransferase n=1 Tax=Longimycelium tulufanense TaxID=907463 RepID=A0A8J3CDS1_9PSEU|nr:GNAT family N-acetyltransferase [Longimycelium tulufanense]GGM53541.1 N-acetyltransferase [Longimycelium tulufanense]
MNGTADPGTVTGPHLVETLTPALVEALAQLWLRVSRGGGAVDFTPDVDIAEIQAAAVLVGAEVTERRSRMLVLRRGPDLVGVAFLQPGAQPLVEHRGMVKRLMVDPALQGRGWGAALLESCAEHARRLGLEQLYLSAWGGTGLPEYYARRGWREVGRLPRAIRLAPGDERDEVWFHRRLV